jgi:threonyl-tRNA synthetase
MLVVGEKERAAGTVAVRQHTKGDLGALALSTFVEKITNEIANKLITT